MKYAAIGYAVFFCAFILFGLLTGSMTAAEAVGHVLLNVGCALLGYVVGFVLTWAFGRWG